MQNIPINNDNGKSSNDDLSDDYDDGNGTLPGGLGDEFWEVFDTKIEWGGTDYENHYDRLNIDHDNDNDDKNDAGEEASC